MATDSTCEKAAIPPPDSCQVRPLSDDRNTPASVPAIMRAGFLLLTAKPLTAALTLGSDT